jgi:type I restriction enzyme M protein
MTEMLRPESGESIYDPTCGSAGMLISSIAYLKEQGKEWRNVKIYGQEINSLTSAIGRMNLFLHGVEDFTIVNGDTLTNPAFVENGKIKQFNLVLANPPYSISQWNREAFASDKHGRNFLGTPPQGMADFAFLQHILKSMDEKNGRCAVLLPRGILSRYSEVEMRKNLIKLDVVECVVAVGKGLFYNSPMEACVMVCRSNKTFNTRGRILLINASNFIEKVGTQSYLSQEHIDKISDTYINFKEIEGFSKIVTNQEALNNDGSLSVSLYVPLTENEDCASDNMQSFEEDYCDYDETCERFHMEVAKLISMLGES